MRENNISIIIPSYNSAATIKYTIDHLLKNQKGNYIHEIIVVDSSDDIVTKKLLLEYDKNNKLVKIINAGIKVMPAIGRNIGAKAASADLLAFIDSDAFPADDWLGKIYKAFEEGCFIGGGSYSLPSFQNKMNIAAAQYYLQFNEFLPSGNKRLKPFSPSCNIFCDRKLFLFLGGFPEIRAGEDTLFGMNASKKYSYWFFPDMLVYHIFREDKKAYARNQKLLGKYNIIFRRQYYNSIIYKGILPAFLLPFFLVIKILRINLRIIASGWRHYLRFISSSIYFIYGLMYWCYGFWNECFKKSEKV